MSDIKIAYIGGGSKHWARVMMQDLALTPGLSGELALYDINQQRSDANAELGAHIFGLTDAVSAFKVNAYSDRRAALQDADFVFRVYFAGAHDLFCQ